MSSLRNVAKMTVDSIKNLVANDFDVSVSDDTAQDIKDAAAKGCLVWTQDHLRTVNHPQINITRRDDQ